MLPFWWGLLGVVLLTAFAHGASINSADGDNIEEVERSKRSYKRGQTQSQYLNFGQPELDGKADAEATEGGSRSTVSGTHGMGQAQSQFSSGDCSGCGVGSPVYEYSTGSPDPLTLNGNAITYSDGKPSSIIGLPGVSPSVVFGGGSFAPGAGGSSGQLGLPGTAAAGAPGVAGGFTPGVGGAAQTGRSGSDGAYGPRSSYIPSGSSTGQIGRPGGDGAYVPGSTYTPGAGGTSQIGRPGAGGTLSPGGTYGPGASSAGTVGRPGTDNAYATGAGGSGQIGRPGGNGGTYTASSPYTPGTSSAGQVGRPGSGDSFTPSRAYAPGSGDAGRPSTSGTYTPGTIYPPGVGGEGQVGRPGSSGSFPPGGVYAPGSGNAGETGRPGTGGTYTPGTVYPPGVGGEGQVGRPGFSGSFTPGRAYAPGSGNAGETGRPGTGVAYTPGSSGVSQGSSFGPSYGPAPGIGQRGTSGQQPGVSLSSQVPIYGADGRQPATQTGQQTPSYGQGGQQLPGSQSTPPGSLYRPGSGFAPGQQAPQRGTEQQVIGYPQQHGYGGGAAQPGPQQVLQQPGTGTISGTNGIPSGVGSTGLHPGSSFQPDYRPQPGSGTQPSQPGGYQPSAGFGRVPTGGGVLQPGQSSYVPEGRTQSPGGFVQPSGVQSIPGNQIGSVKPSEGFVPHGGSHLPGTLGQSVLNGQPGGGHGQPGSSIYPGGIYGQQPGTIYTQPGTSIHPGGGTPQHGLLPQPNAGLDQRGISYQPGKPGTAIQQIPAGGQQGSVYTPGYGLQGTAVQPGTGGGYQQGTTYGHPDQSVTRPSEGFVPPGQLSPGVEPSTGYGQQFGGQPRANPQAGAQYPGVGFTQPESGYIPLPNGNIYSGAGAQQGPGSGATYDSTYGRPLAEASQYGPPGSAPIGTGVQLPGAGAQPSYNQPSNTGTTQYGQGPQQILQPGASYIPGGLQTSGIQQGLVGSGGLAAGAGGADDAFSQAESSIGNGQAAASAQGKKNGGTAKTQVQGTYSSSGSFSASAMTSDNDRSASSQVTGGVEGAMSQSQGQGGAAQSQAQVQINEKTGGTKASSQSGGVIHQSQSEVQANDKGGLADAQSSGPGQTSSQAQIGFRPGQDGEIVRTAGGGQASAQSGVHSGNSQSQIQGTSKYGVSYHGAAQSASGTKEQVATYREQNRDLFNTISQFGNTDAVTDRVDTMYNPSLTSESDIPDLQLKASRTNKEATNSNKLDDDSILPDEEEEEEPYDEYEEEEDYYNENPIKMESKSNGDKKLESSSLYRTHTQTSPTQTQQVAIADPSKKYNVVQNQNGRVQTYPGRTTTEIVPNGFRGTVNVEKKFHTKSLESHKSENKLNITADTNSEHKPRTPDSFVTVTKSITGSMDNSKNPPQDNKNFQSTYYTKSSTCGYFTFSCNIVYGANGRSKICRPKAPTNGKC